VSSLNVRQAVRNFLQSNSNEIVVELTGQYGDLRTLLAESHVQPDSPWLGLEFIGDSEEPVSLSADNEKGLYREFGLIQLHVCAVARIGIGANLESRGEVLRNLFRGRRINGIVVDSVSPINTGPGATLEFEAGYISGTVSVGYHYDYVPGT
jgi:hypothetical protein